MLNLEQRARRAEDLEELGFILVNETHNLIAYRQCILWESRDGRGRLSAVSGVSQVEKDAPMVQWLRRTMPRLERRFSDRVPRILDARDSDEEVCPGWSDWFPAHGLWGPLKAPSGEYLGELLLLRDEPFLEYELSLAEHICDAYAHAWQALRRGKGVRRHLAALSKGWRLPFLAAVALGVTVVTPVRLSVLAPAEVIPLEALEVRAPTDGVVDIMQVDPNEVVTQDQPLLKLDPTLILSRFAVARRKLAVAEAEYRQMAQKAVFDAESKALVTLLEGKRDLQKEEVSYLDTLLKQMEIKAGRAGIAIYNDPSDWVGRPVQTGERILTIADPEKVQLEVLVTVDDAISLQKGAEVRLFLAITPDRPLAATLHRAGFEAQPTPEGTMAYRVLASFLDGVTPPRIGLKGTAKIYGEEVSLLYYLLRRPLSAMRRWIGV